MYAPEIILSDELLAYMNSKGKHVLVIDVAECKTCGGAVADAFARVSDDKDVSRMDVTRIRIFDTGTALDDGTPVIVVATKRFIKLESPIHLGLRRFLGVVDVTMTGVSI